MELIWKAKSKMLSVIIAEMHILMGGRTAILMISYKPNLGYFETVCKLFQNTKILERGVKTVTFFTTHTPALDKILK